MASPEPDYELMRTAHETRLDQERLFQLVASLANMFDRARVVQTLESLLETKARDLGDCVVFGDIAIRFDADDNITSVYRTYDGS